LIHGSSERRFEVIYGAGGLTREEVESVGYSYGDIAELTRRYDVAKLSDGWNHDEDGSEFYFIRNPALGLWEAPK